MNFRVKQFPYLYSVPVIAALILTFINDHYFKHQYPGLITGKISDFTGLFFFPFFLYALLNFIRSPAERHADIRPKLFITCILLTNILFVILKFSLLRTELEVFFSRYLFEIQITPDISDLWALLAAPVCYFWGRRYFKDA